MYPSHSNGFQLAVGEPHLLQQKPTVAEAQMPKVCVSSLELPSTKMISWCDPNFGRRLIAFSTLPRSLRQGMRGRP